MLSGPPLQQKAEAHFETFISSDIILTASTLTYRGEKGGTKWDASFAVNTMSLDYQPNAAFDFLGFATTVNEPTFGGQVGVRQKLTESLSLLASGGAYDGFQDYQDAWISTYYSQQYGNVSGYATPNPKGFSFSGGLRWEYLTGTGILEAKGIYARDDIVCSYQPDPNSPTFQLERGPDSVETAGSSVSLENVLTPRLRVRNQVQVLDNSVRELRVAYEGVIHYAPSERWILRVSGGYTTENPTFNAWYLDAMAEFQVSPRWTILCGGHYYTDTGEIVDALLLSTAAPGVQAWQIGAGVRYSSPRFTAKLFAGPYYTNYDPLTLGTQPYANLYQDRNWAVAQIAFLMQF